MERKIIETERKFDTATNLIKVESKVITKGKGYNSEITFVKPSTEEDFKLLKMALYNLSLDIAGRFNSVDKEVGA